MTVAIADTMARVQELQSMLQRSRQLPPTTDTGFSASLAAAQGPTGASVATAPTPSTGTHAGGDGAYDDLIQRSAQANGIQPGLLKALISQESGFDPNAGSGAGARGLTQLMPGTAAALGVGDVTDPAQSIEGGARYLKQQLDRFHDPALALAAYNAGPGAVERYDGVPPYAETQNYVRSVLAKAQGYGA